MKLGIRRWVLVALLAGLLCSLTHPAVADGPAPGQLTEDQLGQMIAALGLKPNKVQQRFDFAFAAKLEEEEWQLSMSSVLSQDGEWLWVMAWLDELPKTSAEVPRTALLRLLAENDRLGNGKFFAYIPANRRFVLQVSIPNRDMTSAKLQETLKDLGAAVVETYPLWSVQGWNQPATEGAATEAAAVPPATNAPATR
ncbi:MAG: type III secretion system chaperone [Planctomycetaceae bacterium]